MKPEMFREVGKISCIQSQLLKYFSSQLRFTDETITSGSNAPLNP